MKKFKPVVLASIICAFTISLVSIWISQIDWPFLPYLVLAGFCLVWVQAESETYKFLDKLAFGSLIFGFLLTVFIFFRMYAASRLLYDMPLPLRELWDQDMFILAAVYAFLSFIGGLIGIFLKGIYSLSSEKLNWVIILLGPGLATIASLAVFKIKIGGTIMSGYYGLPYSYFTYQIKDVVDGFSIGQWTFSPGSFYHYLLFNYVLYLAIFLLVFYSSKWLNKKFQKRKINITLVLFGLLILFIVGFTSFLSVKMAYIQQKINQARACDQEFDCVIVGNVSPFSCAIVTNKDSAEKISELVKSYPSTGELHCSGREKAACIQHKCQVAIDHTPNEAYWEMLKEAVADCEVASIRQTHNREVTATLKNELIIKAIEPKIDDIFELVDAAKGKCGEVIVED